MLRTKLRNQFLKKRTLDARTKYNKQRNIFVSLVKKAKRNYYENLDLKDINDNKKFWATVKPLFSNKIKSAENIFLDELGKIIRNEVKVANVFNKYFVNMVPSMGITNNHIFLSNTNTSDDPLDKIIDKYRNHPSITCINKHIINSELSFTFQPVTKNQISNSIKHWNDKKAVQSTDIPTKLIKEFCDFISEFIYKSINHCITDGSFIVDFQVAEIRALYKLMEEQINQNIDQLVFFLMFQKYMKDAIIVNHTITLLRVFFQNTNVVFVKALALSMPF